MEILEYDQVDPLQVLSITQLALDFALTPELAAHIRHTDPRPFPCLAIYAVEDKLVMGQVGIFRLPMVSIEGRLDVGGIWAVCTHPHFAGRGIASLLLDEAHNRMREAGLRFSTLGTDRFRSAHRLYCLHGYEETNILATALARWETAHQPTRLSAQPATPDGYEFVDQVYHNLAQHYLGFSWRHTPFERLKRIELSGIWILRESQLVVGYALTHSDRNMMHVTNLLLGPDIDAAEAVAAVAAEVRSVYIQVKVSRPADIESLRGAGFIVANPTWDGFMIKPLVPDASFDDARRLYGIGTDRFLISWLDVT